MLELSNIQGSLLLPDFSPCSTKETSAVHHLWCRILLLLQLWGWCRSPLSLPPFSPHTSVQGEEEGHLLSSAMFLPHEGSCEFRRYALEGNAVWITIWHVWFLTYFFFFSPGLLVFQLTFFNLCSTEESGATIREQHSLCSCCSMDSAADVPEVRRNLGRCGTSPWSKQGNARKEKKSSPLFQFC